MILNESNLKDKIIVHHLIGELYRNKNHYPEISRAYLTQHLTSRNEN